MTEVLFHRIRKAEEMFVLLKDKSSILKELYEKELGDLYNELMFDQKIKEL